jgi:hypothetical protein
MARAAPWGGTVVVETEDGSPGRDQAKSRASSVSPLRVPSTIFT